MHGYVWMCADIHISMHMYMNMHVHGCMCRCTYLYMSVYVCIMYMGKYIHTYMDMYLLNIESGTVLNLFFDGQNLEGGVFGKRFRIQLNS